MRLSLPFILLAGSALASPPPPDPANSVDCAMQLVVTGISKLQIATQLPLTYDYVPNPGKKEDMMLTEFTAEVNSVDTVFRGTFLPSSGSPEIMAGIEAMKKEAVASVKPLCDALRGKTVSISYQVPQKLPENYPERKMMLQIEKDKPLSLSCHVDKNMVETLNIKCGNWLIWG